MAGVMQGGEWGFLFEERSGNASLGRPLCSLKVKSARIGGGERGLGHPPPLALAHQLCQPVPATIAQPGGWRGLNEHPRASCGRWLIKMGVGEGRVWHVRSQVQSQTFFFSIPNS